MSIVGPRPYTYDECEKLNIQIENFDLRDSAYPGITGRAQLNYDHVNFGFAAKVKSNLDNKYVLEASFIGDISIIVKTIIEVSRFRGC